jgi:hypothetical protein
MGGRPGSFPSASSDGQTLEIAGAILVVDAQGDGLDINGTVSMSAGSVTVYGPSADNNSALDYDGTFTLTGGTLLAVGSAGMAQSVSSTSQSVLAFTTRIDAETKLVIADSSGRELPPSPPRAQSAPRLLVTRADRRYNLHHLVGGHRPGPNHALSQRYAV